MFEKILVALDGSDHAEEVLGAAGDLAEAFKAEVRVVHVREVPLGMGGSATWIEPDQQAQSYVDNAVKSLADRGITASAQVRQTHSGRVAAEIIAEGERFDASVIVIGATGVTALAGLILGSVSHKILHLSTLPVFIIR